LSTERPSAQWNSHVTTTHPGSRRTWTPGRLRSATDVVRGIGDPVRILVVLQVAAILILGVTTVARFHIFAVVDEVPHLAYVQEVAEHERLPWLGHSYVAWQEIAIERHTYPRPSSFNPRLIGFEGASYEAWQPPLYYVLASAAFDIPHDYRHKIFAVRAFDLLLLLVAVVVLARLAQTVFKELWLVPYCLALSTLLWPGVIVRAITVSNAALELPLVALYALALWNATTRPRIRSLLIASALAGLCVLTQLTLACLAPLVAVPLVALCRERSWRTTIGATALTVALPTILVAPWLASNLSRYGALTASASLERMQEAFEPGTRQYGVNVVTSNLWRFTQAALPQEWWPEYRGALGAIAIALPCVLLLAGALAVIRRPRTVCSRAGILLAGPLLLGFATLAAIVLLAGWQSSFMPRFLNPMLPLFALFVAWSWTQTQTGTRATFGLASTSTAATSVVWVCMAGAYYFTNVGATLGIHAAA
jgi:Dolichyl-phosphate-mannose-protein mannosyltransferase